MLVALAILIAVFRYLAYPFGDIPDLEATIPEHLGLSIQSEAYHLSQSFPLTLPSNALALILWGGHYESSYDYPSWSLYFSSSLPFVFCCTGLQILLLYSRSLPQPYFALHTRLASLVVIAPSTSYNLISPKNEAITNSLAILLVFTIVQLCCNGHPAFFVGKHERTHLVLILFVLILLFASYFVFYDNQLDIVSAFIALTLLAFLANRMAPNVLSFVDFTLNKIRYKSVLTYFAVFLLIFIVSISSSLLPVIYPLLSNFALKSVSDVSTVSLSFTDISTKYPTIFRPVFSILGLAFSTASGYSVQVFTRLLLSLSIVMPFGHYFSVRRGSVDSTLLIFAILFWLLGLSIFPGYSNYKYWVFLSPLLFLPASFKNAKFVIILFALVYAELSIKALLCIL